MIRNKIRSALDGRNTSSCGAPNLAERRESRGGEALWPASLDNASRPGSESDYLISNHLELARANTGESVCQHCRRASSSSFFVFASTAASAAASTPSRANPATGARRLGARMKQGAFVEKYANLRSIGFLLFIGASIFCLYKVYELNGSDEATNHLPASTYSTRLKLVSVFNRHGDRSPSDSLPDGDPHNQHRNSFWPNGLSNLTETGKWREFRIGLELRSRYERHLDFNGSHFLALSSPIYRCQESVLDTLRGLFDIETTAERGRKLAELYNAERGDSNKFCFNGDDLVHNETFCKQQNTQLSTVAGSTSVSTSKPDSRVQGGPVLPTGSGFPLEYEKVALDLEAVPSLTYDYLNNCKWRRDNPTPVDENLLNSSAVAQLKGVKKLMKLLKSRYKLDFNFTSLGHWSSINNEVSLARTRDSISFSEHYLDWINTPLPEYTSIRVSLFDLWEQVAVLAYRDRIVGTANLIQYGPILTSLLKSQEVALKREPDETRPEKRASNSWPPESDDLRPLEHDNNRAATPESSSNSNSNLRRESEKGTFVDANLYRDKKMIIYSTHDSILQQLMMNLSLIRFEPDDFETRRAKWQRSDDVDQLLAGFKMTKFGASLVLELHETEMKSKRRSPPPPVAAGPSESAKFEQQAANKKFPFIQALLYNQPDAKYKPIEYKRLKFGAACRHKFKSMHRGLPRAKVESMLAQFYDRQFPLERDLSCPYELFKRVTSAYMIQPDELNKLCAD